ncbi:MAG: two-component system response regulator [Chloroflexi bacterium RBG_16_57_11]|nr:MAG: two-component system response regulator [Chloroflexi bacterium RBG_16_57_11]
MARILIADDERDIRELITFILTFAGHEVFPTTNGEEAYQMAIQIIPDLIVLDVRMPRMTGYEVCEQIKLNSSTREIPVVFLSAKGQESEVKMGIDVGAEEYILKPFSPEELIERVKSVLVGKNGR